MASVGASADKILTRWCEEIGARAHRCHVESIVSFDAYASAVEFCVESVEASVIASE